MDKFKNDKNEAGRSGKDLGMKKNNASFEKLQGKVLPVHRFSLAQELRMKNIRTVSARIDYRGQKSKSLIDNSDSKENQCNVTVNLKAAVEARENCTRNVEVSLKPTKLVPAPKVFPSFPNKFMLDFERIEDKLEAFYMK